MPSDLEQEAALVRAFIIPDKQERLLALLGKPKRRRDVLGTLYHFEYLDPQVISRIPAADDSAKGIAALLRAKGAWITATRSLPTRCSTAELWHSRRL